MFGVVYDLVLNFMLFFSVLEIFELVELLMVLFEFFGEVLVID